LSAEMSVWISDCPLTNVRGFYESPYIVKQKSG